MNFKKYSPLLLRVGISMVFLWFGFSQIKNPSNWTGMMPEYIQSAISLPPNTLIYINGAFEIMFAVLLLIGFFTRTASLLLTLHLFHIVTIVGYGAVGARDFALALATFSIFLRGRDEFCLDELLAEKRNKKKKG